MVSAAGADAFHRFSPKRRIVGHHDASDEVPKTSVGKFDKKHIRSLYADGVYDVVECRD